ncbi:DUF4238 domain-containing protein [Limimaricola sp.]|uniref:DUF4238 domain-containing protein n=1 Tax=Limimaricola sp. TaxID=2211665 RepID=UPI00405A48C3
MATKANHHFIPQFYMRGFSEGVGRKASVFAFDKDTGKMFKTLVRNVGSRRNFFRVEVNGVDPNALEDAMAEIEGGISVHLADVIATRSFPSDDHFSSVMTLIAGISARNPRFRNQMDIFHQDVAKKLLGVALSSKEVWDSQARRMRDLLP